MIWLMYHSADLDGASSGALLRYYHEKQGLKIDKDFKMIPMNYGNIFDESQIKDGELVMMSDISLQPVSRMEELSKRCELFVFDHHKSVYPTLDANDVKGIWGDDQIAGCELTWIYLFSASSVPDFIRYLSDWDCWNDQDKIYWETTVKPFQMAIRSYETNPSTDTGYAFWADWIGGINGDESINEMINEGKTIIRYQTEMNIDLMKRSFDIEFEGLRFIVVNGYKGSPQFDSKWDSEKYDAMMSFYNMENKYWTISMYTAKDIDLSVIAQKWGGGGHNYACGFSVKDITKVVGELKC